MGVEDTLAVSPSLSSRCIYNILSAVSNQVSLLVNEVCSLDASLSIRVLFNIMCAPFRQVTFKDVFLGDQLASITIGTNLYFSNMLVLMDLEYAFCFFSGDAWIGTDKCTPINKWFRPLLALLPSLWRFLQCLRRYRDGKDKSQLYNAGKYAYEAFYCSSYR